MWWLMAMSLSQNSYSVHRQTLFDSLIFLMLIFFLYNFKFGFKSPMRIHFVVIKYQKPIQCFFFGGEVGKEFLSEYSHDDNHSFIINSFCVTVNVLVLNIVILHSHFTNTQTHTHRPAHTLFTIYWSKTTEISIVCRSFFSIFPRFFFVFGYIVLWELRWIWNLNFFSSFHHVYPDYTCASFFLSRRSEIIIWIHQKKCRQHDDDHDDIDRNSPFFLHFQESFSLLCHPEVSFNYFTIFFFVENNREYQQWESKKKPKTKLNLQKWKIK